MRRGLPISVIVIDFHHWVHDGDWRFSDDAAVPQHTVGCWPNPANMTSTLRALGVAYRTETEVTILKHGKASDEARKAFRGSLSFPLGLHSGLVAASAVLGRSVYAEMSTAPRWLAGSGPHFLEGALGLAMLSCLYAVLRNKRRKLKSR